MKKTLLIGLASLSLLFSASGCKFNHENRKALVSGLRQVVEAYAANDTGNAVKAEVKYKAPAGDEALLMQQVPKECAQQILRRVGYVVSYNPDTRIPNWVAWQLTESHTTGPYKRAGIGFQADSEAKGVQVTTFDYSRSGYDRGHMCPSGDNKWDKTAQEQSFLMTNICPQDHNLNVGDWNEMENQCRKWAKRYGQIYIVAGPILYRQKHKTIGTARVVVPEAFFKVVLCMAGTPKAIGFIYKNVGGNRPKDYYVNTIDEVERITGIDFFSALPDDIEKKVEAESNLSDW
ncbi:DNA/RNA non-specific endonuclease [Segatella salivae]|uniref:DNA/RNA non-specific endonuclease n=1 Tax=Segatella salivae TaxID=228604 RepID=UPI00248F2044|nr:DNA/RNA non-specific endonuclease [Segatella salivae]